MNTQANHNAPGAIPVPLHWEPMPLTECLVSARSALGITTLEVAARSGIAAPSITRAEKGGRNLTWKTVNKIISTCGYGLEFFFPKSVIVSAAERICAREAAEAQARKRSRRKRQTV